MRAEVGRLEAESSAVALRNWAHGVEFGPVVPAERIARTPGRRLGKKSQIPAIASRSLQIVLGEGLGQGFPVGDPWASGAALGALP